MATDNISKFYQAFNAKYDNFNNEQEFRDFLKGAKRENIDNLYNAFNNAYDNFGSADDMISYLGWSDSDGQQAKPQPVSAGTASPRRSLNVSRNPSVEQAYQQMMAPKPEEKPVEQPQAQPQPQPAPAPAPVEETTAQEPEVNPFPYRGGLEKEMEDIAKMREEVAEDAAFVEEYEKRKSEEDRKARNTIRYGSGGFASYPGDGRGENAQWLKENEARYKQAKENVYNVEKVATPTENAIGKAETDIARRKNREEMASPQEIIATGKTAFGRDNAGREDLEYMLRREADELYASADKEYDKSSKYQEGYEGNGWEQLWTGIKDFGADALNNIDSGSLTFGASKGLSEIQARKVGDKYNSLIDNALKDMKMSDGDIAAVLSSVEDNGLKLEAMTEELNTSSAEIDNMSATYEDMVKRGDPNAEAYGRELQKKIDAYNKRINEDYKPTWDAYTRDREAYETVMANIDAAVEKGLTGGEKALLDALEKFTQAKTLRSDDVSVAGQAGAGAEQSAEFMLDFILTGGISKAGAKAATKIATKRALKKYGAGYLTDLARVGKTVKPGLGLRMAADAASSLARTGVMMPRSIQTYGDNLTEYSGKDEAGRIDFDRSQANAFGNTLLSQYIEYWSEGFGEYFGEAEQALFRKVTKAAPAEAIGKTLKGYRGSIGQYLDKGKFDGMFNEMLEEVVGSTFNALAGWMSGDRVGDASAMKEFFAGENLATLALSFLPMSAIGAATNISAYHKMKERYDKGAAVLGGFMKTGAISEEELQQLAKDIPNLSPAEVKDKIVDITDRARKSNGGNLPSDFAQSLLGYLEGEFAMGLRYDEWEDSQEKMDVVNSYTDNYSMPDPRNAWDLNDYEATAKQEAVQAGFSEEELTDRDAYQLAQEAFELKNTEPERSDALMNYANAKAAAEGYRNGYQAQTQQSVEAYDADVRKNLNVNGTVVTATIMMNGKPTTVYITQEDAGVDTTSGKLTTPTGPDGLVEFRLNEEQQEPSTAKASLFSDAQRLDTDEYISKRNEKFQQQRAQTYETAQNTISPRGMAMEVGKQVGHTLYIDANGTLAPIEVDQMINNGATAVISGSKDALSGVAAAAKIDAPKGKMLKVDAPVLYQLLARNDDGSFMADIGKQQEEAPAAPAQESAPVAEQAEDLSDLRDQTVVIAPNGQMMNAHVLDTADGRVVFEELDENGDIVRTTSLPEAEFSNAMLAAREPAPAAEAPVVEEAPAPAVEETPARAPIPVNEKTGEKMYDAPGVAIEDAIADIYETEGLTEADVDKYIANQAAKAEAARNPEMGNMSPQAWGQAKTEAARVADFWAAMQEAAKARKQPTPAELRTRMKRRITNRAKKWEKLTGVKVNILKTIDEVEKASTGAAREIKKGERVFGWFNPQTNEVYIYQPNIEDVAELDRTVIHEVVSHKGLRELLTPAGYDELCDRVWNELMTEADREKWMNYNSHLSGSEEYLHRAAADEFIADISEHLDNEGNLSLFDKLVQMIKDILDRLMSSTDIEAEAREKVEAAESISTDMLRELLADSMARYVARTRAEAQPMSTGSLPKEIQEEMRAKGEVMDGGTVMDEQQGALKEATGYKTPNELDMESNPVVGDVRLSKTTLPAWAQNYMTYADAKEHVVKVLENLSERMSADQLVNNVVPGGVYKYGEKSSGSKAGPLRTNIEYIVTFDMDTSCPRSLQYLEYVKKIEAQIGRPLTQREMIQLIEMMRVYGQMIPCVYCYCENKRQALKQYYHDFMTARNGVINAKTEEEALAAMYGHKTTKEARESNDPKVVLADAAYKVFKRWRQEKNYNPTLKQLWNQYRNDRNVILTVLDDMLDNGRITTLLTDETIAKRLWAELRIEDKLAQKAAQDLVSEWKWNRIEDRPHDDFRRIENEDDLVIGEETLALWREMTAYGKSASQAKNVLRYVPYTDELKTLSQEDRDYINGMGGLRMHSSNDFRIDYVLDYFQFMADMAVNHMFGHTYTKNPDFVRIFGNSGYKINMSIAAYEDSRGIHPNPQEGFDWNEARQLREQFPNAGVMLMATSDAQVQMALDSDWIDMFIPFHASGLPKAVWYNMRHWQDYSSTQNERFLNGTEMREALEADGINIQNDASAEQVEEMYNDHFNIRVERYTTGKKAGKRITPHFLPGKTIVDGVEIPGHNNDYETYMRLCREWGVHPRFYGLKVKDNTPEGGGREVDISEHPAYMKCIKETARTDTPQTAIEFTFDQPSEALGGRTPIDYAFEELQRSAQNESEAAGRPVRSIYESYKDDSLYGIIPQFIEGVINHEDEYRKTHNGEELPLDFLTPDSRKWFMTERRALESAYKDFDTIPYHPHEYDEDGNLIMEPETPSEEATPTDEEGVRFRKVTSPGMIKKLEDGPKVKVYRSMQFVPDPNGDVEYDLGDGNGLQKGYLYAPMSAKVNGKWRDPIQLGRWEEAEENPDMADENGEFILDKGDGSGPMSVAYAPYLHTRRSPLNEQFSSAYKRGNLVIVESEIPESELTSNYTAEKSKKSTGEHDWPSGKVSNALAKKGMDTRKVILSRWAKPVRLVPNSEVADEIVNLLGNSKLSFPYNVVTPGLRAELAKRGVRFNGWQGNKPKDMDELISRMKEENEQIANTRFRKAPNGKQSNLTDEQWEMVRTPEFKNWFGDWESAALIRQAQNAIANKESKTKHVFVPSNRLMRRFEELLGHGVNTVTITDDAIRHIINYHGSNESQRGQIEMTPEDIATIPYVMNNWDYMELNPEYDDKLGNVAIEIRKRINGVSVVGTIARGKDKEFVVTSWKYVNGDNVPDALDASEETPGLYVRNDSDIAKVKKDIENIKSSLRNSSKIIDENGEPRVVYHGTKWNPLEEEPGKAVFDENRVGDNFDFVDIDWNFFFTASEAAAKGYGNAVPVFLNMRNPEVHTIREEVLYEIDDDLGHDIVVNAHDAGSENDIVTKIDNPDGVIYTIRAVDIRDSGRKFSEAIKEWENEHKQELEDEYNSLKEQRDAIIKQLEDARRELYNEMGFTEIFYGTSYDEMKERAGYALDETIDSAAKMRNLSTEKIEGLEKEFNDVDQKMFRIFRRIGIEGRPEYEQFQGEEVEYDYHQTDMFALDNPNQIKSATDNNGQFDTNNPDIRYSKAVTPEQDKEYMDAVKAGDMEKAQQMVRDAFKAAFPNTVAVDKDGNPTLLFHGTRSPYFTEFAKPGEDLQGLIWTTDDRRYAEYYNDYDSSAYENEPEGFEGIYRLYANVENPLDIGYIEDVVGSEQWNKIANALGMTPQELVDRLSSGGTTYEAAAKQMDYIYDFTRGEEFAQLLVENGYDGVLALEDGVNKIPTIGLVSPNQAKSADPVTYDDNGNVIPLSERFNEENEDIRFSIRGVVGAMNDEVAMQNLDVAEEMEREGKDAQTIWAATGWEKGADGKWRNEIKDATPKEFDAKKKDLTVSDIVNAPELFESYPQLKDIKVAIKKMANAAGAYNPGENSINLDTVSSVSYRMSDEQREEINKDVLDKIRSGELYTRTKVANYRAKLEKKVGKPILDEEGMSIILHELQHAIQRVEGFARGGNTANEKQRIFLDAIAEDQNAGTFAHFFLRTNAANKLLTIGKERIVKAILDNISRYSEKDQEYLQALSDYLSSCTEGEFRALLSKAAGIAQRAKRNAGDNYRALAGEVEARNVEKRRRMSEEERKSTPLSETEDTPRYYQTVRFRKAPTEDEQKEARIANAERQATEVTLDRMGEELGVKINRVTRDGMPAGHQTDKGYYDPSTGEMTICMDNVTDERDAIATVLHETVGHKGLRDLFGDRFREAMTSIYAGLDREGREWVNGYIARHGLGFGEEGIIRGMEEYMSHLAENGNYKTSVWERIKEILGKVVDLVFGTNGFVFTDRELNYILRASYEHLKNPNWLDTTLGKAKDALMKRELGINESDPNKPTDPDGPGTGILFRDGDTGVASTDYGADMQRWWTAGVMENQNADLPVKFGMQRILQELYGDQWEEKMKNLADDEDYLTRHNLASSRAETEAHNFELFHFTPLLEQIRKIQSVILDWRPGKDLRQQIYERILDYMYAVSALERNAWKNAQVEPAEQRDWSGITSLMGRPKEEWQEAEADARAMIDAFRAEVGDDALLDELWDRVRSCTDYSLEHAYKYGLLTREEYERLHGTSSRPRLWEHYLPLRGFAEDTAEDLFDYASYMGSSDGSTDVVKKAKGRWTQADNPLANILRIAEAEIVQGNNNWAKQALYRFAINNDGNTLLKQAEPWYVKDPSTGKWTVAEPLDTESLEEFEQRMQALRAADPKAAKKGRRGLQLDQIMANKGNRNQHMIRLKVGGVDKRIWVNGNPALAKAVNGWGRAKSLQWLRRAGRALSNLFTTYSIDFTAKNLIRDTIYSRVGLIMKEDGAYRHRFGKNWWSNFGYGAFAFPMVRLAAQWESGALQAKPAAARTEKEQMFIDFMTDGGQTGYTIINSVNEIKRRLERSMRRAGKDVNGVTIPILGHYAEFVKTLNEGFELLTRFTAYQTSRQMGRSGQRAALDAKEISVNFNRRGAQSGEGIWGNIASYLGGTHYFYNAGVQGFDNFLRLFKAAPVKMSVTTVGLAMMGILTPMINSMLAGALAGAGGGDGDDDDWYWNVPEWVRRNNIIIGWGNWYLAVPLPVEFRAAYGLGDIAGAAFCYQKTPNRTFGGVAGDMLATAAGVLPVNPIEGYSGSGNLGDAIIRGVAPDAGMFFVDWATNRDYTGRALWKENPFNDTVPKSQGAYASTPKGIIAACQALAQVSGGTIDVAPGLVRDFMNNYGGGFFRAAEDVSKIMTGVIGNDPDRPLRWDNVPFFSGFTGHIDQDRSNSYAQGALQEYKDLSDENVKKLNAICNTSDLTAAIVYGDPEGIPEEYRSKVNMWKTLHPKDYELGKMYREGMNNQYKMKQYVRGEKKGQWYKSNEVERKGVNTLKKEWKDLREQWMSMPDKTPEEKSAKAEMDLMVQEAWHLYYNAEADLADKLMDFEYGK